ncbi:ribonuclease H-like domain-containing protein [Tanacetum coccineum]
MNQPRCVIPERPEILKVNQSTPISGIEKYDGTNNTGKCRPADDEVQQKQAPKISKSMRIWRYRENDCDVIYEVIQFSILWSSRLSRLSPNNKDPESEPEDNSSSMSSSDSEAELEGRLVDGFGSKRLREHRGSDGKEDKLVDGFGLKRLREHRGHICIGVFGSAATCIRGVWLLLQLAAEVFGYCCNLQQGCLDTAATCNRGSKLGPDSDLLVILVGALQYLTFTRPYISYDVQQLHVSSTAQSTAYIDADLARCPITCWSTSGYYVFLGDDVLSWSTKRQATLSRSSNEANIVYADIFAKGLSTALFLEFCFSLNVSSSPVPTTGSISNYSEYAREENVSCELIVCLGMVRIALNLYTFML